MSAHDTLSFAAFVMTYNRPYILGHTLRTILAQSRPPDCVLVIDNGDGAQTTAVVEELRLPGVNHYIAGDNLGPAHAAAVGLAALAARGYDWIFWGDDDDPPLTIDTFERLLRIADDASLNSQRAPVGGVSAVGQRFDWSRGAIQRLKDHELHGPIEVDVAGGGGQFILSARAVFSVGVPDKRLFFTFEDTDYSLRLRRAGYRLLVDGDLMRHHRTETGRLGYQKPDAPILHADVSGLWRRYYSTRNYIFIMRTNFDRPDLARREAVRALGRSLYAIRRGPRYAADYAHMSLRGVVDGYTGRLGRTVLPRAKYRHDD